jgi:hypothetical protein
MKIAGFIIARNVVKNDYPIKEAIQSVLPMVDEMIVLAGDSEDNTNAVLQSIQSSKIKIFYSVWDKSVTGGGSVYAVETNKAFQLIDKSYDWAFYIQADEVVHEKYHAEIIESCKRYKDDKRVEGLLFKYLHFYGTYDYVGDSRRWYNYEVRIIRNDKSITSYKDAQGFRKEGKKLNVKLIDAYVYHYGWVKSPKNMQQKRKEVIKYYNSDNSNEAEMIAEEIFNFNDFDSLKKFEGTHPAVMQQRIQTQNWQLNFDTTRKQFSLKNSILYWIEKMTGKRLFSFRNYNIIR